MADEEGETPALETEVQEAPAADEAAGVVAGGEDTGVEEAAAPEVAPQEEAADEPAAPAPEEGAVAEVVEQAADEPAPAADPDAPAESDPPAAAEDPPAAVEGDATPAADAEPAADEEHYEDDTEPAAAETPEPTGDAAGDPPAVDGAGEPAAAVEPGAVEELVEGRETVAVEGVSDESALGDDAAAGGKHIEDPGELSGALMEEALPEPLDAPEESTPQEPAAGGDASLDPAASEAVAAVEGDVAASEPAAEVAAEVTESAPTEVVEGGSVADAAAVPAAEGGEEGAAAIAVEPEAAVAGAEGEGVESSRPATTVPTDDAEPAQEEAAPEAPYSVSEVTPQAPTEGGSTPDLPVEAAAPADENLGSESDGEEPDENAVDAEGNKIEGAMKPKRRPKQRAPLPPVVDADSSPPTDGASAPAPQEAAAPAVAAPVAAAPVAKPPVAAQKVTAAEEPGVVASSDAITPEDVVGKGLSSPSMERSPRAGTVESLGDAVHPPSPSKKAAGPWLQGTFKTPKGRVMTAEELCVSLQHMTSPYSEKFDLGVEGPPGQPFIGTGIRALVKTMPPDEIEAMVGRLYTSKEKPSEDEGKMEHQMLRYDDTGKEKWVPVKKVGQDEQKEYMCELYQRCLDSKKKANEALAVKYLQPLGKTRRLP